MIAMTDNGTDASIEIDGPGANQMAESLLGALGIGATDITDADIALTIGRGGDDGTTVQIVSDGPQTGAMLQALLADVEWSDFNVEAVAASVSENGSGTATSAGTGTGTDDADTSADGGGSSGRSRGVPAFKPQVTPFVERVDPEYVQFPGQEPARLKENTHLHAVGCLLMEYRDTLGEDWVTAQQLGEFAGDDLTASQVQSALSRLFTRTGLTVRRQVKGAGTRKFEYHPTKQLAEEIQRLGEYDSDRLAGSQ